MTLTKWSVEVVPFTGAAFRKLGRPSALHWSMRSVDLLVRFKDSKISLLGCAKALGQPGEHLLLYCRSAAIVECYASHIYNKT